MVWTYRRQKRHLARMAVIVGVVSATVACLPQGQPEDSSPSGPAMGYAGGEGGAVSRSGKSNPFQDATSAASKLFLDAAGRRGREEEIITASTTQTSQGLRPSEQGERIVDTPANTALGNFFQALAGTRSSTGRTVTILHLGDSHIAADRFSGDLREEFQRRFGDAGRGMLMPGLYLARGVKFERGGRWQAALSTEGAAGPFGLTGATLSADSHNAWLRLTATGQPFSWAEITLQNGPGAGGALIGVNGETWSFPPGRGQHGSRTVRIKKSGQEILIKPRGDGRVTVHSIRIGAAGPGVRYVNFGLSGATAATPLSWDGPQLSADMRRLAPDLIILGYGTEEAFDDQLDLTDYERKVAATLARLRQAAPRASFLVIGPPDMARRPAFAANAGPSGDVCRAIGKKERRIYARLLRKRHRRVAHWHPPLQLDGVRAVLRRVAAANRAYFWDWSKLMGGTCGIHAWVHASPPLAANNHIHLTAEGSKRSARHLFRELMTAYDAFERAIAAAGTRTK